MNEKKQNNDLIKEIIEKHFENMVDDVLAHTETYYEALGAISSIKGCNIPDMIRLADCLRKALSTLKQGDVWTLILRHEKKHLWISREMEGINGC